jgi:hypothetical protein
MGHQDVVIAGLDSHTDSEFCCAFGVGWILAHVRPTKIETH